MNLQEEIKSVSALSELATPEEWKVDKHGDCFVGEGMRRVDVGDNDHDIVFAAAAVNAWRTHGPTIAALAERLAAAEARLDWVAMNGQGVRRANGGHRNLIVWGNGFPNDMAGPKANFRAAIDTARGETK